MYSQGFPVRRILIVGDMAELGEITEVAHRELGEYARLDGVDEVWSIGKVSRESTLTFGHGGRHFDDKHEIIDACKDRLRIGSTVLVKGSRSAGMDEIVRALGRSRDDGKKDRG